MKYTFVPPVLPKHLVHVGENDFLRPWARSGFHCAHYEAEFENEVKGLEGKIIESTWGTDASVYDDPHYTVIDFPTAIAARIFMETIERIFGKKEP